MMQQILLGQGGGSSIVDLVSYNIIGGGGGSGSDQCSAGGAGASLVQGTYSPTAGVTYIVTIGAGGPQNTAGGASSLVGSGINAIGPGGGAGLNRIGGSNASFTGGADAAVAGGGGAGADGNGSPAATFAGGNGGYAALLLLYPTSGLNIGGGGAGAGLTSNGNPFDPGGSIDPSGGRANAAAPANRGGGGGGAENSNSGNSGGSGRVILRYVDTAPEPSAITGNPLVTVSGGYRHYDFLSAGSITF